MSEARYLIACQEGCTTEAILEAFSEDETHLAVISPTKIKKKTGKVFAVKWTPKSAISAKNAILTIENTLSNLPLSILVFPDLESSVNPTHAMNTSDIDNIIDNCYRGISYLLRELLIRKASWTEGLVLCLPAPPSTTNAITSSIYQSMRLLGEKLFEEYRDSKLPIYGFCNIDLEVQEFARSLKTRLAQPGSRLKGRWNDLQQRQGFFSNIKK